MSLIDLLEGARRTANWETTPMWAVSEPVDNPNTGSKETNLLSLSYGRIIRKDIETREELLPESFDGYQIVEPGDTVLRLTGLQNDQRSLRSGLVRERGIITSAYLSVRPTGIDPRYLSYVLYGYDVVKAFYSMGGGLRQSLKWEDLRRLPLPIPPVEVQRRVADFLDDQVTRIDNIIQARREQHDEMRALALSAAATITTVGGIGTENASRTGIPWMPERNSDWPLVRIGYLCVTGSGTTPPSNRPEYFNGDIPWVNSGDITDDGIRHIGRTVTRQALNDLSALKVFAPGALVVAMYGQGETKGRVGLLPEHACVNQACCVLCPDPAISPGWLLYWLRSHKTGIVQLAQGSGQPNLNQELIRNLRVPLPSRDEQDRLLPVLETQVSEINAARGSLDESIDYLSELKRSLITAAVSGEFDVSAADGSGVEV